MRLPKSFYKLPLRLDIQRLQAEVAALPPEAWVAHPNAIEGNSAVRLISADGAANDAVHGTMLPTPYLQQCPYIRQVLTGFGVVWSRSRLMRLAPHAPVPEHADINYHWCTRVRLHMPVFTRPDVRFHCGDQSVHMAAGEAWLFDNWRLHRVENPTDEERIHLVADTTGSAAFWQFVAQSELPNAPMRELPYDPARNALPLTERALLPVVMPPAEVELLMMDFRAELVAAGESPPSRIQVTRYRGLIDGFCRDWRQLYLLHGEAESGWTEYARLRDSLRDASRQLSEGLMMQTNRVAAHTVLQGRLLQHVLHLPVHGRIAEPGRPHGRTAAPLQPLKRPVFIVAAPRSGSTLLFETLAVTPQLCTLGGEAHWLVEGIADLRPLAPGVGSNRLTAQHASADIAGKIVEMILRRLQQADGTPADRFAEGLRLLEKTPKNVLRIPFFDRIFPEARFIFLWRDPRENISSIMEAWKSGNWTTYRNLPDWDGPWSLLLPPGWQALRGRPLEEIAAFQWESANRTALEDLSTLGADRWTSVNYEELLAEPGAVVRRLCDFSGISFDAALEQRCSAALPLSRYTQTEPSPGKWRQNEQAVSRVLPGIEAVWQRLLGLSVQVPKE